MKVLIDTSAWIESFRATGDSQIRETVASLVGQGEATIAGIITLELLKGANEHELEPLERNLSLLPVISTTEAHFVEAGHLGARLRHSGQTLPTTDLLIATLAISYELPLLCRDQHFDRIAEMGNLKIFKS
jgi:predicted nucleic acid-binding protein